MRFQYLYIAAGLLFLLVGCTAQLPSVPSSPAPAPPANVETKYVCSDGTVVASPALCPTTATPAQPAKRNLTADEQLSVCAGMPEAQGTSLEDMCIIGLASKNKEASLCAEVSRDARPSCYAMVAVSKNDVNICNEAGTNKNRCYEEYARTAQDATACDKIGDVNYRDNCYNNLFNMLGDFSLCEKIVESGQKNSCYLNAAMRTRDVSYCNKITFPDQQQNCLQNIGGGGGSPQPVQQYK